ncbi:polysaccharide biosynthesis tyrosine autokinase [Plantibacter sp. YIM 135249]|uniref:polysaccharide biosynthesis tyrosine autokinase n=1 Tax=Plantibacter sp. YIM 135249 TaxID=3423918 RepID=UPI003D32D0E7
MGARDYLQLVKRGWYLLVAATLLGAGVAGGLSLLATPVFSSTASLYFSLSQGNSASDLNQGSTYTQNQMLSFAQLATSAMVLDPVIDDLGLDKNATQLGRRVTVTTPQNTVILNVVVTDRSGQVAADIANGVADQLVKSVEAIAPRDAQGKTTVSATTIDAAVVPQYQSSPDKPKNVVLGALIGFVAGLLIILLRELIDNRVRTPESLAAISSAPLLGRLDRLSKRERDGLAMLDDPRGPTAEAFRQLRSSLQFVAMSKKRLSVVVTSSIAGEGKSTVAINLALTLAETYPKVIVVDADLRRPMIAEYTQLEGAGGLTTVLVEDADLDAVIQQWAVPGLHVLPAGTIPPNPSELLSSTAMARLVERLVERYDVVIIDSAPVLSVADASILSQLVDGTVIVADTTQVRRAQLSETLDSLAKSGAKVLGVVLNKVKHATGERYEYQAHTHAHVAERSAERAERAEERAAERAAATK